MADLNIAFYAVVLSQNPVQRRLFRDAIYGVDLKSLILRAL